jgi:hypothetical protein
LKTGQKICSTLFTNATGKGGLSNDKRGNKNVGKSEKEPSANFER